MFSEEQEMYVDASSANLSSARRSLWLGVWCAASLGKSLCGGDAASSTPRGRRSRSAKQRVTLPEKEERTIRKE